VRTGRLNGATTARALMSSMIKSVTAIATPRDQFRTNRLPENETTTAMQIFSFVIRDTWMVSS